MPSHPSFLFVECNGERSFPLSGESLHVLSGDSRQCLTRYWCEWTGRLWP
ncbi:hypothetical protein D187_002993 [Cystobacter fuscus DSM 2262]|uniref:Uncharacterized protein n=1 Tax=Cystobacter fuscus (strain ATCC 25194 / DSM 2262 / NBRC 100088 / M29) TaxID=1242864 RepID=S9QS88_CYSF2|nr:hypothetical protein D187_002993 [Cystobacter fuscus DSM 2262]